MGISIGARWAAAALLAVFAAAALRHHFGHQRILRPGDRLIPLSFISLSGEPATVTPDGHPRVINVFATWCPPCRAEAPAFAAFSKQLLSQGVRVVGIDQQEEPAAAQSFAHAFSLPYPVYIDASGTSHDVLGARVIPTTIYVDAAGAIRWERSGPLSELDYASLARAIRSPG